MPRGIYEHKRGPRVKREEIKCIVCGTVKQFTPAQRRRRTGKFCSPKCMGASNDKKVNCRCGYCGKEFRRRRDKVSDRNFCSINCASGHRGAQPSVWGKTFDREKRREYFREYTAKNKEKLFALSAKWARENRNKRNRLQQLRRGSGSITQSEWDSLFVRAGRMCAACGGTEKLQVDHIVPISRGGRTELGNLQILCRRCNISKGARLMLAIHGVKVRET